MSEPFEIVVVYPCTAGAMSVRTEIDWDLDAEPVASDGVVHVFRVAGDRPFLYFKPLLRDGGESLWARGENALIVRGEARRVVYPHFRNGLVCGECEVKRVPSALSIAGLRIRVFEPAGYRENSARRYPVLYMQDGQNLFFDDEAFAGRSWHVQDAIQSLEAMNLIDSALVVGIYPEDRMRQYTRPGYDEYGRAVVGDLVPWIDATFRTLPSPQHRGLIGSSLGGVVSMHLAWAHPEVFGSAACLSSTFGHRDDLAQRVRSEPRRPIRLYLDSGWPRDNYEVTLGMRNLLIASGFRLGHDLQHFAFPGARHDEQAWGSRLHLPLQFLLGRDLHDSRIPAVA